MTKSDDEWWRDALGDVSTYGNRYDDDALDENAKLLWEALYDWKVHQYTYPFLCSCAAIAAPTYEDEQITGESLAGALLRAWDTEHDQVLIEECYDMMADGFDAVDAALSLVDSVLNRV